MEEEDIFKRGEGKELTPEKKEEGTTETKKEELSMRDVRAAVSELIQKNYAPLFEEFEDMGFKGGAFSVDGLLEHKDKILGRIKDEGKKKRMESLIVKINRFDKFLDMFASMREEYEDSGKKIPQGLLRGLMSMIDGMKEEVGGDKQQPDPEEIDDARRKTQAAYEKE